MNRTTRLPQRTASPGSALGPAEAERAQVGPPAGAHTISAVAIDRVQPDALPGHVAAGIEALSGMSLGDVRVRYRSPEPARVQAAAFTRGNEIHVAPGAEHHLAHEAWHVVQQRRGRVRATSRTTTGHPLNDDDRLEREADVMGARAVARGRSE
ncbi:MAG TPA: DUF4157 domain-containing protein [Candidatus Elarobacter sp.]|jgi:hypothetical protein|nr:DUF4157 domain-containing protein [Candidatus Elarobacter sp.]